VQLLTQWRNSAGERVRIALNLKRLDYDYVAIPDLAEGTYTRLNPQGLMPALYINGQVIAQSTAILEYLEETWPVPSLLPGDPVTRAQARSFAQLIACDLHPLNNNRVRRYLAAEMGASDAAIAGWYQHWATTALVSLEAMLAARPPGMIFSFGDEPGWAELHLVPQLANARRFDCDLAPYRRLLAIEARCLSLEAFQRARPEAQPDYPGPAGLPAGAPPA
jgi:maleylpyruvate isomerase